MQTSEEIPRLARSSRAALREIAAHLTPDDRATLRTMPLGEPPMAFWIHLAAAPREQSESTTTITVWKMVLRTLGSVGQLGQPVGAVLAETKFPKDRMSRLLTATGGALTGALDEAGRWLMSHDIVNADLSALLALGQINPDQCACFVRETSGRFTVLRGVHRFSRLRCASVLRLTCSRRARKRRSSPGVDVIRGYVVERLVQAPMVVVLDEACDGPLECPGAVVLLELHDVLHRPVIALDLALRHRVTGRRAPRGCV